MDTTSPAQRSPWLIGLIGIGMTVVNGLLTPALLDDAGAAWAAYVVGAVLALVVWLGLFFGLWATRKAADSGDEVGEAGRVGVGPSVSEYLMGASLAVAFGVAMVVVMDSLSAWAIGAIFAIAIISGSAAAKKLPTRDRIPAQ